MMWSAESQVGHQLKTLFVTWTQACNSRCLTCNFWRQMPPAQLASAQIETEIVEAYERGMTSVYFTGGEPLLRADELFDLVDRLHQSCPGLSFYLLTNGLMLKKYAAEIRGRFSRVIVSLDAANAEIYHAIRGVHSFQVVIGGIGHLRHVAPEVSVRLRTLVVPENVDTLCEVALLARDLRVDRLSFLAEDRSSQAFGLVNADMCRGETQTGESLARRVDIQIERIESLLADYPTLPVLPDLADLRRVSALYRQGFAPALCNTGALSCVVDADATVLPCFFIHTDFSLKGSTLAEVRNSAEWQRLVAEISRRQRPECLSCVCPRFDVEDCVGDA